MLPSRPANDSPLFSLKPDDLHMLTIWGPYQGGTLPDDRCTPYIAHLTGLRILHLQLTSISAEGIKSLMPLKNLQRLALSKRVTDQTMAVIGQMSSLEGLYLAGSRLTNAGLAHLAQIPSLRYLLLKNEKLTDSTMASPISRSSATSRSWTSATQRPP